MAINAKAVIRVIIEGEWIWVERGTFSVMPFEFVDDDGHQVGNPNESAYFFISTNGDPYFGPLSKISLMKLDTQLLAESESVSESARRMLAIGPASDGVEEFQGDFPGQEQQAVTPTAKKKGIALFAGDEEEDEEAAPTAEEPEEAQRPAVPLFAEDVEQEPQEAETRRGGLF